MKKSELKQLIQEVIQEEKFGRKKYFVTLTRDYKSGYGNHTYKKGERVSVELGRDGIPYIVAGHGATIDFPPEVAKLSTVQSELPDELVRRMGDVLRKLEVLTNNKSRYYSDVFTDEVAKKFVSKVEEKLKKFVSTKSPIRKMEKSLQENYRGIIGWAEFVTPIQKQKVDELERKGFKVTHTAFDAGEYGDPGEDKSITVYLTKRSGPSSSAFEVDSEGNVN